MSVLGMKDKMQSCIILQSIGLSFKSFAKYKI